MTGALKVSLTRRYRFAASHRLHNSIFSDEKNREIYGKCNNPYGHGHNYVVEVTVTGPVDEATGMIANLGDLDPFVQREVIEPFDQTYLNTDAAEFRQAVPTTENLASVIYRRLAKFPKARVERISIEETSKNSFEIFGDGH